MCYPVKKWLLLLNPGNMRPNGNCNIARAGKLMYKIAADDEQKFPKAIWLQSRQQNYYATITYWVIIGPLSQRLTSLVIDTIDTRSVI